MIEKTTRLNLLYDFYKKLLTEKQQYIFELYFQDDLSFGEIAEELHISRQAANDTIRRVEATLLEYENKLMLVHKYELRKKMIEKWRSLIQTFSDEDQTALQSMIDEYERLE